MEQELPTTIAIQDAYFGEDWGREQEFERELAGLINRYSLENGSNTPDFIIARYLVSCLKALNATIQTRSVWYAGQRPPWKP